jgi:hypothetical protein
MGDFHRGKRNAGAMRALVDSSGFLVALLAGIGASLFAVIITPRTMRSMAFGVAAFVAALAGLAAEDVLNAALPAGLLLVAAAALATARSQPVVRTAALAPGGALLVTLAAEGTAGWARAFVFVTIIVAGPAAAAVDRRFPYLTFALLAVSALGAYATVPDTEQARALVGALLPVALIAFGFRRVSEASGPIAGVALVAWVALVGGVGRPGSVVGAIGCLGVLALGPLSRRTTLVLVVAVHVAVVSAASRVAGLRQSAWTAAAVVLPVMVVAAALLAADERSRKENPP